MRRTARLFALAGIPVLLACSESPTNPVESPTNPVDLLEQPPATAVLAFVSTRDLTEHIYVANADGSEVTRVAEGFSPAWSWDGRKIAFVRARGPGPAGIYVVDLDSAILAYAGPGHEPAWTPDGRILFTDGALRTMSADGSDVAVLVSPYPDLKDWEVAGPSWPPNYRIGDPTPSPDGRSIWFRTAGTALGARVGVVDADGSNIREVEELRDLVPRWQGSAWSPGGSRVAILTYSGPREICDPWLGCRPSQGMDENSVIYSYDPTSADLGVIDVIYPVPAVHAANPDWSPDGSHLVLDLVDSSPAPQEGFDRRRVFILSVETGEVRRLIPDAENLPVGRYYADYDPVWSRAKR